MGSGTAQHGSFLGKIAKAMDRVPFADTSDENLRQTSLKNICCQALLLSEVICNPWVFIFQIGVFKKACELWMLLVWNGTIKQ
ncbi:hypothetical protein CVT25_007617 [Psilocybe cyanescens]|uniref:Uncharacterized protein n=1 Tax=Psilocybe cyanescens TaxID=93625 RepID=A0A409X1D1_PSICY|nr:hypothetical protein CVT25_007617 [Psilocybe cyanescens]